MNSFRILGVDIASFNRRWNNRRISSRHKVVTYGTIKNAPKELHSACLWKINREIRALIEQYNPVAVAIEGTFFAKNAKPRVF